MSAAEADQPARSLPSRPSNTPFSASGAAAPTRAPICAKSVRYVLRLVRSS